MPVVISFTTGTDGRLPTGQPLAEAIREVDAATGRAPPPDNRVDTQPGRSGPRLQPRRKGKRP